MEPPRTPRKSPNRSPSRYKHHITERPRTSTLGPLEVADDPLAQPPDLPPKPPPKSPISHSARNSPRPPPSDSPQVAPDFSYLLQPDNFHPLTQLDVPPAFRSSTTTTTDTALPELLQQGHFRAAAITAASQLTHDTSPTDHARIFSLLYTRLICLQLLGLHVFASQEAKHLQDLDAPSYHDPATDKHLMPWELRVLAIRLQALGFGDWRRGAMAYYYDLAQDAREELTSTTASSEADQRIWRARLQDLGIHVANALLEMGDFDGAARHLQSLQQVDGDPLARVRLALVHLRCGSVEAARKCIGEGEESAYVDSLLGALCCMAEGKFEDAVAQWTQMKEEHAGDDALVLCNLATSLLYVGQFAEARTVLEALVQAGHVDRGITFNLATLYELCSDTPGTLKQQLVEQAASRQHSSRGWERSNADFKM